MGPYRCCRSPTLTENAFGFSIAEVVGEVLARSASKSAQCFDERAASLFDATEVPPLGIRDYVLRLHRYLKCSEECFIVSLALLERILESNPGLVITDSNVHRFFLASCTVAAKFQDDDFYSNPFYARVGGVANEELLKLEAKFFEMLDWTAHVTMEQFEYCVKRLDHGSFCLHEVAKTAQEATTKMCSKEVGIDGRTTQQSVIASSQSMAFDDRQAVPPGTGYAQHLFVADNALELRAVDDVDDVSQQRSAMPGIAACFPEGQIADGLQRHNTGWPVHVEIHGPSTPPNALCVERDADLSLRSHGCENCEEGCTPKIYGSARCGLILSSPGRD